MKVLSKIHTKHIVCGSANAPKLPPRTQTILHKINPNVSTNDSLILTLDI
ncbi:hypothetical protein PL2TA16_03931 [Pseudoalteromonas luteoviolacea 2ta16]|uniref:Uncharacterized protein n=1 Tax=Pseudoalteromonas luteoviolacea (strain 2ta16) TaxID=1353533 RepID=V4HSG2_PSEL2|nr:hypothetical protein PL2TA16_03931 [Pseudoalteromonas luteoviolacea 2ta16]